ncbi:glycosyltransferase family 39 protein [Candidatus Woesearchaeota archaeon]|nr:glycosyltransferase family 39 protein [Candidatus Woesearchaeota archaeon]
MIKKSVLKKCLILFIILLVAFLVRSFQYQDRGIISYDEYGYVSQGHWTAQFIVLSLEKVYSVISHPEDARQILKMIPSEVSSLEGVPSIVSKPLFAYTLGIFYLLYEDSIPAAILLNSMLGAIIILLIYYVGVFLFDERTGFIAAILGIFNPMLIQYSQQATSENLSTALFLIGFIFLISDNKFKYQLTGIFYGLAFTANLRVLVIEVVTIGTLLLYNFFTRRETFFTAVKNILKSLLMGGIPIIIFEFIDHMLILAFKNITRTLYQYNTYFEQLVRHFLLLSENQGVRNWQYILLFFKESLSIPITLLAVIGIYYFNKEGLNRKMAVLLAGAVLPLLFFTIVNYKSLRFYFVVVPFLILCAAHAINSFSLYVFRWKNWAVFVFIMVSFVAAIPSIYNVMAVKSATPDALEFIYDHGGSRYQSNIPFYTFESERLPRNNVSELFRLCNERNACYVISYLVHTGLRPEYARSGFNYNMSLYLQNHCAPEATFKNKYGEINYYYFENNGDYSVAGNDAYDYFAEINVYNLRNCALSKNEEKVFG